MQASAQLAALGDHSQLYSENDRAERQQRKLSREQVSRPQTMAMLWLIWHSLRPRQST